MVFQDLQPEMVVESITSIHSKCILMRTQRVVTYKASKNNLNNGLESRITALINIYDHVPFLLQNYMLVLFNIAVIFAQSIEYFLKYRKDDELDQYSNYQ